MTSTTPLTLHDSFAHLCGGQKQIYTQKTFHGLVDCIVGVIHEHRMPGLIITQALDNSVLKNSLKRLEPLDNLTLISQPSSCETGFFIALTQRQCALIYWQVDPRKGFQRYRGGWTFHPRDVKEAADQLGEHLNDTALKTHIEQTPIDRRYDDKLGTIITNLVEGLETQNVELAEALKQVQTLNQKVVDHERLAAIGKLCSVVAHEIRNPLGLIDLYAKLIEAEVNQVLKKHDEPGENIHKNVDLVRESIASLEKILSELTQYSRPLELDKTTLVINDWAQSIYELFKPQYEAQNISLMFQDKTPEAITLEMDKDRVKQALTNLLKNALEVSQSGDIVTMSVASRQGDDKVLIKVEDQGRGVEEKAMEKLFTPYFSTKKNGTGLGLAHSLKILQTHGGSVDLLKTSEKGSVFALVLPKNP